MLNAHLALNLILYSGKRDQKGLGLVIQVTPQQVSPMAILGLVRWPILGASSLFISQTPIPSLWNRYLPRMQPNATYSQSTQASGYNCSGKASLRGGQRCYIKQFMGKSPLHVFPPIGSVIHLTSKTHLFPHFQNPAQHHQNSTWPFQPYSSQNPAITFPVGENLFSFTQHE